MQTPQLKEGQDVRARVVGFLPGRKVVLEVNGEVLLAVSNVPLVRGMMIRAIVERQGHMMRLRILDEEQEAADETDLEAFIHKTARMLHLQDEPALFGKICKQLQQAIPELQSGPVEWSEIQSWVRDILEAQVRGLPGTPQAWGAVRIGSEARLGTALARLRESLDAAAVCSRGSRRRRFSAWSADLQEFFLDINEGPLAPMLQKAVRQCGYLSTIDSGDGGKGDFAGTLNDDLRQALFQLAAFLGEFREMAIERQSIDFRRALERSLLWCVQAMEIVEGLQAQNTPANKEAPWSASLQIPVEDHNCPGTLFAVLSMQQSSFWLDVRGKRPLSARVRSEDNAYRLDLYLPTGVEPDSLQVDWGTDLQVDMVVHEEQPIQDCSNVDLVV